MKDFTLLKSTNYCWGVCWRWLISTKFLCKTGIGALLPVFLFFIGSNTYAQTVDLKTTVQAGFGIDADVQDDVLYFNVLNFPAEGTDDWTRDEADGNPATGAGVIEAPSASQLAGLLAGNNVPVTLRMSEEIYTYPEGPNGELWIDAVYYRDTRSNGDNVDLSVFEQDINKNFNDPTDWGFTSGSIPQKNDIIDVYAHLRRLPESEAPKDYEFAIVGASTRSNNGDSYVDFEYYREDIALNQAGDALISEGEDCGHTAYKFSTSAAPVPNPDNLPDLGEVIRHGDIILSVNFTKGGKVGDVRLYVWIERSDFPNDAAFALFNTRTARPFNFGDANGNFEYHSDTNCDFGYARISLKPGEDPAVFAQINSTEVPAPYWNTIDRGGDPSQVYEANNFFEIAVNATLFGFDTRSTGGECQSPLGSLLVKTRSSDSFTASLKDFAGPFELGNTPEISVNVEDGSYECFEESTTLIALVNPPVSPSRTYTYQWYVYNEGYPDGTPNDGIDQTNWEPLTDETSNTLDGATADNTYRVEATVILNGTPGCTAIDEDIAVIQENPAEDLVTTCPDLDTVSCTDDISTAFSTWLGTFAVSGGGGEVTATYTVTIDGGEAIEYNSRAHV